MKKQTIKLDEGKYVVQYHVGSWEKRGGYGGGWWETKEFDNEKDAERFRLKMVQNGQAGKIIQKPQSTPEPYPYRTDINNTISGLVDRTFKNSKNGDLGLFEENEQTRNINKNMKKQTIKINESQLRGIVRNSIKEILKESINEMHPLTLANYANAREKQGQLDKAKIGRQAAVDAWNRDFANTVSGDNGLTTYTRSRKMDGDYTLHTKAKHDGGSFGTWDTDSVYDPRTDTEVHKHYEKGKEKKGYGRTRTYSPYEIDDLKDKGLNIARQMVGKNAYSRGRDMEDTPYCEYVPGKGWITQNELTSHKIEQSLNNPESRPTFKVGALSLHGKTDTSDALIINDDTVITDGSYLDGQLDKDFGYDQYYFIDLPKKYIKELKFADGGTAPVLCYDGVANVIVKGVDEPCLGFYWHDDIERRQRGLIVKQSDTESVKKAKERMVKKASFL